MEQTASPKYRAFISYSHRDAAFGRRLHRQLEAYAVPRSLVGTASRFGPMPRRLRPIFRDREELPASSDLSLEVQRALSQSACLIVVCSPSAAASRWVFREIEIFRRLYPERPILAALIEGDPDDAYPHNLRSGELEPLAADFRPARGDAGLALLKLAAGALGVGLDDLVRREAIARRGRATAIAIAAAVAFLAVCAPFAVALSLQTDAVVRQEAERQRTLVEMFTRARAQPEGAAMFNLMARPIIRDLETQDLRKLPAYLLADRARIFIGMGEFDLPRGDVETAVGKFREADRATALLVSGGPANAEHYFLRAQSIRRSETFDSKGFRQNFSRSRLLQARDFVQRAAALQPSRMDYQMELAWVNWTLCIHHGDASPSRLNLRRHCLEALHALDRVEADPYQRDQSKFRGLIKSHMADLAGPAGDGARLAP